MAEIEPPAERRHPGDPTRTWSPKDQRPLAAPLHGLRLFALDATAEFGRKVSLALGQPLAAHEERAFEDGEHKGRPLESVDGTDVYVVQSLHGEPGESAHDKLCRLLFFIGALRDASAAKVTAVAPYLCYGRKDRRTKPFDPVTTRYVAALFEAVGADAIVTLEAHNPAAFENAFSIRAIGLSAAPLYLDYAERFESQRLCVVSPDAGGSKRAELLRGALEGARGRPVGNAFAEKHRSAGVVSGELFVGDVAGAHALIVDDLISTGGTLLRTARAARKAGAQSVTALAAHGLFMAGSEEMLNDPAIGRVAVTDTVPPFRVQDPHAQEKLDIISSAPLFAEAILRLHQGRALTDLLVF